MVASTQTLLAAPTALSRARRLAYAAAMEPSAPDDCALMLRYCEGDVAAFETLYRRHNDAVFRYLLRLCGHRSTAEDVFQEAWSKIIKARDSYRPTAQFNTFLYRVAHNCFIDHVRRNKRHVYAVAVDAAEQPHPGDAPDVETERKLARRRLEAALADLPEEQRDVFLLHEEAGFDLVEIATITGAKHETVKSRLRYAVAKLRAAIDEPAEIS